ncbi:hypothetical protein EVAR_52901_1 [Eumeta japonica]|uniref:Uncharacterized protein n=1 Tax=Eumeta variegata TaxID=151549 RepID=A0A4C1Z0X6_EUMVA|nr:hypothetical protein EVAR_52901_1 [Eumeta japonica]
MGEVKSHHKTMHHRVRVISMRGPRAARYSSLRRRERPASGDGNIFSNFQNYPRNLHSSSRRKFAYWLRRPAGRILDQTSTQSNKTKLGKRPRNMLKYQRQIVARSRSPLIKMSPRRDARGRRPILGDG